MKNSLAIQIPIKGCPSKRVPGKNFRELAGIPLFGWTLLALDKLHKLDKNIVVYIDTESHDVYEMVRKWRESYDYQFKLNLLRHIRPKSLAEDTANGNHLLVNLIKSHSCYTHYMQSHITTPFTKSSTYLKAAKYLLEEESESIYTATNFTGWIRNKNIPINYKCDTADGLGRSQDYQLVKETTDSYGVSKKFFEKYNVRTNSLSLPIFCSELESLDIDTEHDFMLAELLASEISSIFT